MQSSFYIFGGEDEQETLNAIASFDTVTKKWKKLGELKHGRYAHGVIIQAGEFVVVGGTGSISTERCILNGESIKCTTVDPELENYNFYPEMMSVPENYCSNKLN